MSAMNPTAPAAVSETPPSDQSSDRTPWEQVQIMRLSRRVMAALRTTITHVCQDQQWMINPSDTGWMRTGMHEITQSVSDYVLSGDPSQVAVRIEALRTALDTWSAPGQEPSVVHRVLHNHTELGDQLKTLAQQKSDIERDMLTVNDFHRCTMIFMEMSSIFWADDPDRQKRYDEERAARDAERMRKTDEMNALAAECAQREKDIAMSISVQDVVRAARAATLVLLKDAEGLVECVNPLDYMDVITTTQSDPQSIVEPARNMRMR